MNRWKVVLSFEFIKKPYCLEVNFEICSLPLFNISTGHVIYEQASFTVHC